MTGWDIAILIALALAVFAVVIRLLRQKKKGGCAGCPYAGECRNKGEDSSCSRKP